MILRTKIIALIAVVLLASVSASSVIVLGMHRERVISAKVADVQVLSGVIERSIERSMALGATEEVQGIIESIGRGPELLTLRILSQDGYILKSKDPGEIGLRTREYEGLSHLQSSSSFVEEKAVTYRSPILNRPECFGCHSEGAGTIGVIEIRYDIARSVGEMMATRRMLVVANMLIVLFVAGVLGVLLTRMVMRPLGAFLYTIKAVEEGDLDRRAEVPGTDEFSQLGRAFNAMLDRVRSIHQQHIKKEKEMSRVRVELDHKVILEELNTQLQYKVKEVENANRAVLSLSKEVKSKNIELEKMVDRLKRINEVGRVLSSIINPDELLKIIVKTTAETLGVRRGSIHVTRDRERSVTMRYEERTGVTEVPEADRRNLHPLYQELLLEGRSVLQNRTGGDASQPALGEAVSAIGVPLRMKGQIIGGMLLEDKTGAGTFGQDDLGVLDTMANQAIVAMENAWLYETVKTNYFGTIQSLVNALEASDRYTRGHSERVRFLGVELARYIGLDYRELEVLEHAAILHDIGKIGIDTSVLNKEDKLTTNEFSLIRAHPIIGDEILGPIGTLQGVRTTILQHHERYDGKGYPYGIAGEEITLKARILAVIDTFDAMLTDRPYRRALDIDHALTEIKRGMGTQFDPAVVTAFMELVKDQEHLLSAAGYNVEPDFR
jgi:HD-GYP domain-containing protein (c-di-GMP phosphodiesterase class II)